METLPPGVLSVQAGSNAGTDDRGPNPGTDDRGGNDDNNGDGSPSPSSSSSSSSTGVVVGASCGAIVLLLSIYVYMTLRKRKTVSRQENDRKARDDVLQTEMFENPRIETLENAIERGDWVVVRSLAGELDDARSVSSLTDSSKISSISRKDSFGSSKSSYSKTSSASKELPLTERRAGEVERMLRAGDYKAVAHKAQLYEEATRATSEGMGEAIEKGDWELVAAMADQIGDSSAGNGRSKALLNSLSHDSSFSSSTKSTKVMEIEKLVALEDWAGVAAISENYKAEVSQRCVALRCVALRCVALR